MPQLPAEPAAARPYLPPSVQPVRAIVWFFHLALPLAGLWLLLARPELDVEWNHKAGHFWLVLVVALTCTALGIWVSVAARHRADARLVLVSMAFLASAGFFALHALATPGVLTPGANIGFDLAQPVGLAIGAGFAAVSSLRLDGDRAAAVLRHQVKLWAALGGLCLAWAVVSLLDLPPLNRPPSGTHDVEGPLVIVALVAVAGFVLGAVRYYLLYRRTPSAMLISIITAFVLLAEANVAVIVANKWHLSWWEWHVLLVFAFGFVGYSAWIQYRREGTAAGLFDAVTLDETTRRIRAEYESALEELVTVLRRSEEGLADAPVAMRLADRFGFTEGQAAVLDRAGAALARERDLSAKLGALVAVGERARVGLDEAELMAHVHELVRDAYGDVSIGLVAGGAIEVCGRRYDPATLSPDAATVDGALILHPLVVRGRVAGILAAPADATPEPTTLAALANQVSVALENSRLYRELESLFRAYLSPDVASALLADPSQAGLGGSVVEVTALFADLRGFSTFSESVEPEEIVSMLNRYHGVAVPCVLDNGGTVVQFVGDALLAVWGAPARQEDQATRAVRAALDMQQAVAEIAAERSDWPRFRVGANTGPALVGNIGSEALRGFNAMGDAVNVAARLQELAEPGQVVIGESTRNAMSGGLPVEPLGDLMVKGRVQPVRAYVVRGWPQ